MRDKKMRIIVSLSYKQIHARRPNLCSVCSLDKDKEKFI